MRSIERYLLGWIMGALVLGSLLVGLVTYLVTLEEMNEVFDANLKNVAEAVASYYHAGHSSPTVDAFAIATASEPVVRHVGEYDIVTVAWTPAGVRVYSSHPEVDLPFGLGAGLARVQLSKDDWIVFTVVRDDGVAQAAQRVVARQTMAGESAAQVLPPLFGLAIVVGGLLVFGLRRGLRPLDGAAADVAARSAGSLSPIETRGVPREVAPLVSAINDLMRRLAESFAAQRRFLADAAHELRSPVTALRLQLQLLDRSTGEAERKNAMAELMSGVDRSQKLIEKLLQVARAEPEGEAMRLEKVDLGELVRSVVGAASTQADHRGIDLGAKTSGEILVEGDLNQLRVLLENLVENALRYSPNGSVVDVEALVSQGRPMLRVVDDGPGIPEAEREHVFDRFYRGEDAQALSRDATGSGLGLAIVKAIAQRHRAVVSLNAADSGPGLEVRVVFEETR
jgi:two-component system OmpR family sensor kinase